jgi:Ni/Co efflux regulator RcnB
MKKLILFLIMSTVGFIVIPAHADAEMAKAVIDKAIEGGFSELEKQIIEKYFKSTKIESDSSSETKNKKNKKQKELPPGLAKKEKLPPGLANQLERNGTLPPGLAKRNLPDDLNSELPEPAEGLERAIVDNAVVLVEKATGRIVDILKDVVTGNN